MYYPDNRRFLEEFDSQEAKLFVVTGTKGKTSLGLLLESIIRPFFQNLVKIDTTGVYFNNEQVYDRKGSTAHFGYPPTVMPARYLYSLFKNRLADLEKTAFILEASLSCGIYGTGLANHDIGILTNILSDHIDGSLIKSRKD